MNRWRNIAAGALALFVVLSLSIVTVLWLWAVSLYLTGCAGANTAACDPVAYMGKVRAAYAARRGECAAYETVDECPAYHEVKAEVRREHVEFVECR